MKAFWWLKENSIAGMARPGFNFVHWFDLPFDEAVLFGWLGLFSTASVPVEDFRRHYRSYAPRIYNFHKHDEVSGPKALEVFKEDSGVSEVMERLLKRTRAVDRFYIDNGILTFETSAERLAEEIHFLKSKNVKTVVSLTEKHHGKEQLEKHFNVHHFAIPDLGAPKFEQVVELSQILKHAREKKETVVVHCLAGIGRTSLMLNAAHIILGEDPEEMEKLLKQQNKAYAQTPEQRAFVQSVISRR